VPRVPHDGDGVQGAPHIGKEKPIGPQLVPEVLRDLDAILIECLLDRPNYLRFHYTVPLDNDKERRSGPYSVPYSTQGPLFNPSTGAGVPQVSRDP